MGVSSGAEVKVVFTEASMYAGDRSGAVQGRNSKTRWRLIRTLRRIYSDAISVLELHTLSGSHSGTVLATGGTECTINVWVLTSLVLYLW